jgi:hypothetical protein
MNVRLLARVLAALAGVSTAAAGGLSLEAHEIGTGDARSSNWETDYGSYDRDFARSKQILVTLHNMSRKPTPFAVTVYFIGKPTVAPNSSGYDPRDLFIYDRREHAGEFHKEIELTGTFRSRTLTSNVQHYQLAGVESASGNDMVGWIVVGYSEGQRFGVAASSQELLQLSQGQSPRQSFEAMIADYEKKHPSTLTAQHPTAAHSESVPSSDATTAPIVVQPQPTAEFITLTRAVEVKIAYGKTTLPAGTQLRVVSRRSTEVNAYYMGDTVVIPANSAEAK